MPDDVGVAESCRRAASVKFSGGTQAVPDDVGCAESAGVTGSKLVDLTV